MDHGNPESDPSFKLQILATTDLHMRLLPYDYRHDRPDGSGDLATLATLIEQLRRQNPNTLLVDNGDFLQGTPMADLAAEEFLTDPSMVHPAIAAMNAAGYDAGGIGNHEFDFGLPLLMAAIARAEFPFLSANLMIDDAAQSQPANLMGEVILVRRIRRQDGQERPLQIGVLGLTPRLSGGAGFAAGGMIAAARAAAWRLRSGGADIVLALCHAGMATAEVAGPDDLAKVAALDGIDAVIGGHTHRPFPGPYSNPPPEVDIAAGTIAGTPVVAPGAFGTQLGRIALDLVHDGNCWRIASTKVDLLTQESPPPGAHPAIVGALRPAHEATRRAGDRIVGRALAPLRSAAPLLAPDPCLALLARAQARAVAARLAGSPWSDLPLLSAVAPRQASGASDRPAFIEIPEGDIRRRQVFELAPFPDRCCAILATGAQVRGWLTRSASIFLPIRPGERLQPLLDPGRPCYSFDILHGLTYRIDLGAPTPRIASLRYRGVDVSDDDSFVVALGSHRLGEDGLDLLRDCPTLCEGGDLLADALLGLLGKEPVAIDTRPVWRFVPLPGASAWIDADEAILPFVPVGAPMQPVGPARDGTQRFEVDLSDWAHRFAPAAE